MSELHELSALELGAAVKAHEVGVVELVGHFLDRVTSLDDAVGAFVTVTGEAARAHAAQVQQAVDDGTATSPLAGVPTAIKDLQATRGVPTKLGSPVFAGWVPEYDDHVVTSLFDAGMPSLGKTATPEIGLPCYTETDIGPPARTPWDTDRLAGGSSGGAAAAVAAGLLPIAQGSDGGGSVRIPASVTGLIGLKTSRGRVSRGPIDLDSTGLSVVGPLALTVRDAAAFLDVVAGPRPGDPDALPPLPAGETFLAACEHEPGNLRIGRFVDSPIEADLDPRIREVWEQTSRLLESLGHEVVDVAAPLGAEAVPLFETVWAVSAATAPIPFEADPLLRPLTRYLRERGRQVSGVQYAQALGQLRLATRRALAATAHLDAVLTPTVAQTPRPVGWFTAAGDPAADFELQKRFTPYTALYNVTGQPAISLPLGWTAPAGGAPVLPVGMMLVGRPAGDAALLTLAAQVEAAGIGPATSDHRRAPLVTGGSIR